MEIGDCFTDAALRYLLTDCCLILRGDIPLTDLYLNDVYRLIVVSR